jgi:SAM-dependent methyltransferase
MDERIVFQLTEAITGWDQAAWCLAALAVGADHGAVGSLGAAARDVMSEAGLGPALSSPEGLPFSATQLTALAVAPLQGTAALASGRYEGWAGQDDSALLAQGQASGATAALFARFALPILGDLGERLATPGARMLDVGTGIGALAIGFAQTFPQLCVTGIDVLPRVLDLARAQVAASPVASRVQLRLQDVADLTDEACYDLAWLPAPFVPEPALNTGNRADRHVTSPRRPIDDRTRQVRWQRHRERHRPLQNRRLRRNGAGRPIGRAPPQPARAHRGPEHSDTTRRTRRDRGATIGGGTIDPDSSIANSIARTKHAIDHGTCTASPGEPHCLAPG